MRIKRKTLIMSALFITSTIASLTPLPSLVKYLLWYLSGAMSIYYQDKEKKKSIYIRQNTINLEEYMKTVTHIEKMIEYIAHFLHDLPYVISVHIKLQHNNNIYHISTLRKPQIQEHISLTTTSSVKLTVSENILYTLIVEYDKQQEQKLKQQLQYVTKIYQQTLKDFRIRYTDALTGAYNRHFFRDNKYRFIQKQPIAVYMIDIDYLKEINDKLGHEIGDNVLKNIYQHMKQFIRYNDSIIRWGGDEFVLLVNNVSLQKAITIGERIRNAVYTINPLTPLEHPLSVSLGLAYTTAVQNASELASLLHTADEAVYVSKKYKNHLTILSLPPSSPYTDL